MKDAYAEIARQEIQVMKALQERPRTRRELEEIVGAEKRRIEYVVRGLREVGFVYRVPGTHLLALD